MECQQVFVSRLEDCLTQRLGQIGRNGRQIKCHAHAWKLGAIVPSSNPHDVTSDGHHFVGQIPNFELHLAVDRKRFVGNEKAATGTQLHNRALVPSIFLTRDSRPRSALNRLTDEAPGRLWTQPTGIIGCNGTDRFGKRGRVLR